MARHPKTEGNDLKPRSVDAKERVEAPEVKGESAEFDGLVVDGEPADLEGLEDAIQSAHDAADDAHSALDDLADDIEEMTTRDVDVIEHDFDGGGYSESETVMFDELWHADTSIEVGIREPNHSRDWEIAQLQEIHYDDNGYIEGVDLYGSTGSSSTVLVDAMIRLVGRRVDE